MLYKSKGEDVSKKLLKTALKLQDSATFSQLKPLIYKAREYQEEIGEVFLYARARERVRVLDYTLFWSFLSDICGVDVKSFEDIEGILNTSSRKDNIRVTNNSKSNYVSVFDKSLLLVKRGELPKLYRVDNLPNIDGRILAIENGETFLSFDKIDYLFDEEYILYLGGNTNSLTREFIKDKDVLFFIDFDIVSMNFYDNISTKSKSLYIPDNFEELFAKYSNNELYLKQRYLLREEYSDDAKYVIEYIVKYQKCLEQEIVS